MTHETVELIERARRRLSDRDLSCTIAGGASDAAIDAAEESLGCPLPPSYRAFLRKFGALALPPRSTTIHQFVGLGAGTSVVERTELARVENKLGHSLVIVGLGAEVGEWYCLDTDRAETGEECPVFLFDARDNQLDQEFYADFDTMVREVFTFLLETLDESGDASQELPAISAAYEA